MQGQGMAFSSSYLVGTCRAMAWHSVPLTWALRTPTLNSATRALGRPYGHRAGVEQGVEQEGC